MKNHLLSHDRFRLMTPELAELSDEDPQIPFGAQKR